MNIPDEVVEKAAIAECEAERLSDDDLWGWDALPSAQKEQRRRDARAALTAAFEELGIREEHGWGHVTPDRCPDMRYVSSWRPVESSLKSEPRTSTLRPVEGGGDGDA